jgi:hypothetical protein
MSERPTLPGGEDGALFRLVAHVVRGDVDVALELIGLVRSGRVTEVTREGAFGRYTLSARGAVFAPAEEPATRSASLDEWERCVREWWAWSQRQQAGDSPPHVPPF